MIKCKRCHERYEGDVCPLCGLTSAGKGKKKHKTVPGTLTSDADNFAAASFSFSSASDSTDINTDEKMRGKTEETVACDYRSALTCPVCSRLFFAQPRQKKEYRRAKRYLKAGIILSVIMFLWLTLDITLKFLNHASDNVGLIETLRDIIFYESGLYGYGSSYCKAMLIAFIIYTGILFIAGTFLLLSLRFTSKTPDLKTRGLTKFFLGAVILLTLHCVILGNYYSERYSDLRKRENRRSVLNTEEAVCENVSEIYYIDTNEL